MTANEALQSTRAGSLTRERLFLAALLLIFICSGASGLIYQVVWVRMLALVFGVTSYAISTVLSAFFGGLALGSFFAGRYADRLRSPLRAYAFAEVAVAALGLLTPVSFWLAREAYVALNQQLAITWLPALTAVRFLLAFLLLLLPTTLMGATLPLMVRSSLARSAGFARNLSLLYAANTFGAMAGAFLAGFELIGRYGLRRSLVIAALLNLLAAGSALLLARSRSAIQAATGLPEPVSESWAVSPWEGRVATIAVLVFGVSGAVSIAYEVVWARLLAIFFDASIYGFTAMLTMVLLGIGLGSWLISPLISRRAPWPLVLAGIEAAVGLLGLLAPFLLTRLIPLGERLGLYRDPGSLAEFSLRFMVFAAFVVVFPPMLLLGASFPVVARIVGAGGGVARRVGGVYAVNVVGGIAGSLLGGFLLLPTLGAQNTLLLLAVLNLALALPLVWAVSARRQTWLLASASVALVAAAVLARPSLLADIFRDRFAGQRVVWVDEGLENTVAVTDAASGERKMYINGQPQASTVDFIARFQRLIGHLPMVLHPQPTRALVIGLGGGATAGAVASYQGASVDLVELSSAVVGAAPLFGAINEGVLDRPNVRLRVNDGRNFLLLGDERYDVITADIIRPTHAGAGNLYSREYYRLARERLAEGGLMLQWLEQLSEEDYKLLLRAFVSEFPYVTLWADGSLLVGSNEPQQYDRATLAQRLADPGARASLAAIGLNTPDDVLKLYTGSRDEAFAYLAGETRATTDDRPYVEFFRGRSPSRTPPDLMPFRRDLRQILKDN